MLACQRSVMGFGNIKHSVLLLLLWQALSTGASC